MSAPTSVSTCEAGLLRHNRTNRPPGSGRINLDWRRHQVGSLFQKFLEHVDDFAGVSALEFDVLTYHFSRRNVDLVDDLHECANHTRIFRHQNAGRFRQREKRSVRLWRGKILPEHLLEFLRIGVTQFEEIADDMVAFGNIGFVGNDRHARGPRTFSVPMTLTMSLSAGTSE